ncbi:hypothetical protein A0H81_13999 [Grifola frondosa]|uniref:F-box domain-containing protein n=1 Tax=Grifola frondosa TaxID=5627 RepID=A0A1C7LMM2_GRIFR|nr:hypothetical protein A0H81_13999 [Grifola frondosa]
MTHRALNSFDILLEIFDKISTHTFPHRRERRTLARSARVCRSFSEPALRVLWRTLDSLSPARRLLITLEIFNNIPPRYQNTTEEGFSALLVLPPEIPQQAWARFQQYASYVRTVRGVVEQSKSLNWIALASRIGNQPLFPCLQSITLDMCGTSCTKMLCFMAPSIDSLTIYAESCDDQSLETFLDAISIISPNAVWTLATASPSLFHRVEFSRFSALCKVEVAFSSHAPDLFEKLSRLDYLNDLAITHGDGMVPQIGKGCFAALQTIEILVHTEGPLPELLTDFSFPRLQSAHIAIGGPSDISANRRQWDATEHPLMELLEPLLALRGMRELKITTTTYLCISRTFPATSVPSPHCERLLELRWLDIDVDDVELCRKAAEFIKGIFPGEEDLKDGKIRDAGWKMCFGAEQSERYGWSTSCLMSGRSQRLSDAVARRDGELRTRIPPRAHKSTGSTSTPDVLPFRSSRDGCSAQETASTYSYLWHGGEDDSSLGLLSEIGVV